MSYGATGSPIIARQNVTLIATIIIVTLVFIGVLVFIGLVFMYFRQLRSTPEWMAKQKNKPTKLKNIDKIAKKYDLDKEEHDVLWDMCKKRSNIPNIEYLIHEHKEFDNLFRDYYKALVEKGSADDNIASMFKLKTKFERVRARDIAIGSSKNIPNGTILTYLTPDNRRYIFPLLKNAVDGLYLQIPHSLSNPTEKPAAFTKIKLLFTLSTGINYELNTRIVRYQTGFGGLAEMVVTHSNDIIAFTERHDSRLELSQKTVFSAVKVNKAENESTSEYRPLDHKYQGVIIDISGGGCKLVSKLLIKKGQYIWVQFKIDDAQKDSAIGRIVNTTKNPYTNEFNLHIKFVKISVQIRNKIMARIYGYTAPIER